MTLSGERRKRQRIELGGLRRDFDNGFALPPRERNGEALDLLALRVGADSYAVRVAEIKGVSATRGASNVPSLDAELEGLVGIRGVLVPLFGLASLLGCTERGQASRWFLLVGEGEQLGLGFQALDGYLKCSTAALSPATETGRPGVCVPEVLSLGDRVLPVISIPRLIS